MGFIKYPTRFVDPEKDVNTDPWAIDADVSALGVFNNYVNYTSQIEQTLKMKKGSDIFGCYTLSTVINFLSAFILGENAIPVYNGDDDDEKERFNKWVKEFLSFNNTHLGTFREVVTEAVTFGRSVASLKVAKKGKRQGVKVWNISQEAFRYNILDSEGQTIKAQIFWSAELNNWQVKVPSSYVEGKEDETVLDSIKDNLLLLNFSLLTNPNECSYKPHFCLTEMENMDRALKDIRKLNDKGARITPVWEVETDSAFSKLTKIIQKVTWKIGQAVIGTGKFHYEVADTGKVVKGVLQEFETNGQAVSSTCNVPVHYIALTTLMSNRSTAETLYDVILHGTALERERLKDYFRDMYLNAQQMYIDDVKDSTLTEVITDFSVPIEVIDKSRFKEMVEAYEILYDKDVISKSGFRKIVPNVDPKEEDEQLEKEKAFRRVDPEDEPDEV